jgi:uncharacterized protein (DUF111 family)
MDKKGLLIITQLDHLSGEEIGWALESLSVPGVRNRNLIPTLTKKGRMGFLLVVDIDPEAEPEVGRLLMELFGTHGYHRVSTRHVHRRTVIERMEITVQEGEKSLRFTGRLKKSSTGKGVTYTLESDDLFELQKRIREEWGTSVKPVELRRRIESATAEAQDGAIRISL